MDCPSCGTANPAAKKFCGNCGAPLSPRCPACGADNPPGKKFCGDCGAALAVAAATPPSLDHDPVALARPSPIAELSEGERRQVTVLFADLSGYTALSRELDAEELHALAGRFLDAVDAVVEGYGGAVDKHIGDCVMATFGAPVAHGNDAERAVRAALDIQRRIPALTDARGRPLGVHVGIASGQVVASGSGSARHRAYTVTGETVNLASRLTDKAVGGETLIADAVYRVLADRLECSEAGRLTVKGFAEPVPAWRLLGLREAPEPAARRPFVGRRAELRRLRALLAACRESGRGRAVYIRGEAGIGKTRLVEEVQAEAKGMGFACHAGLVLDFGAGTGRDAIRSLVRSLLGLVPKQNSTGGKTRLGRISKMGDRYLRELLVVGMTAVIRCARRTRAPALAWVNALLERRPARLVTVALANKTARVAWAILARGEVYRAPAASAA